MGASNNVGRTEEFKLENDKPTPALRPFVTKAAKQKKMFAGMDCLPGQEDLFETDGEEEKK